MTNNIFQGRSLRGKPSPTPPRIFWIKKKILEKFLYSRQKFSSPYQIPGYGSVFKLSLKEIMCINAIRGKTVLYFVSVAISLPSQENVIVMALDFYPLNIILSKCRFPSNVGINWPDSDDKLPFINTNCFLQWNDKMPFINTINCFLQ